MEKKLYIIGGCNGAGKTTASYTVLPDILNCREFVNADEIAHGLSPFNPGSVAIESGKLMLRRIKEESRICLTFTLPRWMAGLSTTTATRLDSIQDVLY